MSARWRNSLLCQAVQQPRVRQPLVCARGRPPRPSSHRRARRHPPPPHFPHHPRPRKAYRLGKFLQGLDAGRKAAAAGGPSAALALAAAYADACYYVCEQFVWLGRAGVVGRALASRAARAGAWAELGSYAASSAVNAAALAAAGERRAALLGRLAAARRQAWLALCGIGGGKERLWGGGSDGAEAWGAADGSGAVDAASCAPPQSASASADAAVAAAEAELAALDARVAAIKAAIAQDVCDALLAVAEIKGEWRLGWLRSEGGRAGTGWAGRARGEQVNCARSARPS